MDNNLLITLSIIALLSVSFLSFADNESNFQENDNNLTEKENSLILKSGSFSLKYKDQTIRTPVNFDPVAKDIFCS